MSIAFVLVSFPLLLTAASHADFSPSELPVCTSFCSSGEGRVWAEPFRPDDLFGRSWNLAVRAGTLSRRGNAAVDYSRGVSLGKFMTSK
jgi:hypothetical protein